MCGIVGCLGKGWSSNREDALFQLRKMSSALQHRGPDGGGEWVDDEGGIGLGHRRLAIIDLSDAGHQPMVSQTGRYVLVFNGEIYNHQNLKARLISKKPQYFDWKGHSDTEIILAWIETYGLEDFLRVAIGMFAFALWDQLESCLTLARDRFGEKPLYYGVHNGAFLFASELKALKEQRLFKGEIDRQALNYFSNIIIFLLHFRFINQPKNFCQVTICK